MFDPVVRRLKRTLARHFPVISGAYHQVRHDVRMRRALGGAAEMADPRFGFRFLGPNGMAPGTFEPAETEFLQRRLPEADVFVDVGANAGYYVCLARHLGKRVVAFEPAPGNLELLCRNLQANAWPDVEVFPMGVGAAPGLAALYGDGTSASLVTRWAGVSDVWKRTIPLTTLDAVLSHRFASERLIIKIDVEGAEHGVIEGATATLDRSPAPVWLIEICFRENFPGGAINPRFEDVFRTFWAHGYSAWSLEAHRAVEVADVQRWISSGARDFGYVSYVFERCG